AFLSRTHFAFAFSAFGSPSALLPNALEVLIPRQALFAYGVIRPVSALVVREEVVELLAQRKAKRCHVRGLGLGVPGKSFLDFLLLRRPPFILRILRNYPSFPRFVVIRAVFGQVELS